MNQDTREDNGSTRPQAATELAAAYDALRAEMEAIRREAQDRAGEYARMQRELRSLRARQTALERQLYQHKGNLKTEVRALWEHPAIRRLVRFNALGLKVLGLFGLFGNRQGRTLAHLQDLQPQPRSRGTNASAGAPGKRPAPAHELKEDHEVYLRGFCSLAHVRARNFRSGAAEDRIAIDVSRLFSPHLTGVGHYCEQLARALLRQSAGEVVAFSTKPLPEWILNYAGTPDFVHVPPDLAVYDFAQADRAPDINALCGPVGAYFHTSASYYPIVRAARQISFLHDIAPITCPESVPERVTEGCKAYNRYLAKHSVHFIANSEYTKQDFVRFTGADPERIDVVPVGMDPIFRRPIEDADCARVRVKHGLDFPYLLCVGTLQPRKNLLRLLEAYRELEASGVPLPRLVLTGSDQWAEVRAFSEELAQLQHGGRVLFTGYVDRADMPALYAMSTLFVYPSYFEGYGMPVAEAMCCGAPVVCGDRTSLPEVAGDAAVYFDPYSADAIAAAIRDTLANEAGLQQLRERALLRAESFLSWEDVAARYIDILRKVRKRDGG